MRASVALGGFLDGAAAGAIAFAVVLLVLRVLGLAVPFASWWAWPILVPAMGLAGVRVRGTRLGGRISAQHLDRRLGLDGLLLTAREADAGAWRERLTVALREAAAAFPRPHVRRMLGRLAASVLVLAIVAVLPAPEVHARSYDPLGVEVLDDLEERLDALAEAEVVEPREAEEMRRRIDEARDAARRDGVTSWADVDALEDRLEHQRDLKAGRLAKAAEDLAALADAASRGEHDAAAAAETLEAARQAGLLDGLSPELRERLGLGDPGGKIDPSALASDPDALRQLAAALAEAAGDELGELADADLLEGIDLDALDERLDALLGELEEGEPCELCDGTDEDCPG